VDQVRTSDLREEELVKQQIAKKLCECICMLPSIHRKNETLFFFSYGRMTYGFLHYLWMVLPFWNKNKDSLDSLGNQYWWSKIFEMPTKSDTEFCFNNYKSEKYQVLFCYNALPMSEASIMWGCQSSSELSIQLNRRTWIVIKCLWFKQHYSWHMKRFFSKK
jgi:hypothetical protein